MKKLILFVLLAATGCGNSVQPFRIARIMPLVNDPGACSQPEDESVHAGSAQLDVAAGGPQVTVGIQITGRGFTQPGLALKTGEILEYTNSNQPVLTNMKVTYRLSRRLGASPKVFNLPLNLSFAEASGGLSAYAPVPLVSAELGDLLVNGLTASDTLEDSVDIEADIEFEGETSGTRQPITSGITTFPIHVVKSNPAPCPAGQIHKRYPFFDARGDPDTCRYVGLSYWQFSTAEPPKLSDCCTPGTSGC